MKVVRFLHLDSKGWIDLPNTKSLDSPQTLVLAFCAPAYIKKSSVLCALKEFFPQSVLVGCSTSGEIHGESLHDMSISVTVLKFEHAQLRLAISNLRNAEESEGAGIRLAEELLRDDLKGVVVLSDGLKANGSALVKGLNSIVDSKKVVIGGGLAGDGSEFKNTWIYANGEVVSGGVLAVGLYGAQLALSSASLGGWDIFGPERTITKSRGNVVYEIDYKPALDLYKSYLGEKAKDLPASGLLFPLQVRNPQRADRKLVRTLLAVSEGEKSMTFAGDVPQGFKAQLMKANFERIIDAAGEAAELTVANVKTKGKSDSYALAVSCVGRRLVLGEKVEEEIEAVAAAMGKNCFVSGFYSYGEIGTQTKDSPCDLHNQTMTVFYINEDTDDVMGRVG